MPTAKILTPVLPGRYYHIYNRGINSQKTFLSDYDYRIFLAKYEHYISDHVETLAYCLMPNHYHFLIRVNDADGNSEPMFGRRWAKLILSYTYIFSQKYAYTGNLFHRCFRRLEVKTEDYLRYLIYYIHSNPLKHGVYRNFNQYPFSSFGKFNSADHGIVNVQDVIRLFGSKRDFFDFHETHHYIAKNLRIQLENTNNEEILVLNPLH